MAEKQARQIRRLLAELVKRKAQLQMAETELGQERDARVAAQRAYLQAYPFKVERLCTWLEENSEATVPQVIATLTSLHIWKRRFYDPDKDPVVMAEIAAGRIPPLGNTAPNDH